MADETKPSVPGSMPPPSGPSPLSPQIKVPPQQPASTPPSGLPTRPSVQPSTPPPPPLPKPAAPTPTPAPAPAAPLPSAGQPAFKSSIRTMQEDLSALKKGQAPAGVQVEKQPEKEMKPAPEMPGPKITPPPPRPTAKIELGELEKARPFPGAPVPPPIRPMAPEAAIKVPEKKGVSLRTSLAVIIGLLVVAGAVVWFFVLRKPAPEVVFTPTPTPQLTPPTTPQGPAIESAFSIVSPVELNTSGGTVFSRLESAVDKGVLAAREPGLYKISDPTSKASVSFSAFMSATAITPPLGLNDFVDDGIFYLSLQLKTDNKYGHGFIVRLRNTAGIDSILKGWEQNMPRDFKNLFGVDSTKASSVNFSDNAYKDASIRFRNFPDPNKTIDYAVVTMQNGEQYLVVTNSREHMYGVIDQLSKPIQ